MDSSLKRTTVDRREKILNLLAENGKVYVHELSEMFRVKRVASCTSRGSTVEWPGTRRTSSKVNAFFRTRMRALPSQRRDYTSPDGDRVRPVSGAIH